MAFSLKLSYSKVRASFTHLGRGGHLYLMPTPRTMFRILSVTCLLTRKALRFNYYFRLAHGLNDERFCIFIELQRFE